MSGTDPRPTETKPRQPAPAEQSFPPTWVLPAVMIAVLTIGGWFVIQSLADTSKMEDCTMSGRRNCVPPIDTSSMSR